LVLLNGFLVLVSAKNLQMCRFLAPTNGRRDIPAKSAFQPSRQNELPTSVKEGTQKVEVIPLAWSHVGDFEIFDHPDYLLIVVEIIHHYATMIQVEKVLLDVF
jgi:hypothetical protein